ncbi:hypothetical protein FHS76_001313 [Ochrobactrum daejeonense]|uniref:Uncharacterized protein n=1 Tax=Brucella daejeonensis TaxID=659015 RepID=A0A7W9AVS0_9HYPH|nr:hypothetical protein [Brucella daejeonensis]MBB5701462.1 hypothetical protein [Brucella daejeonensis]
MATELCPLRKVIDTTFARAETCEGNLALKSTQALKPELPVSFLLIRRGYPRHRQFVSLERGLEPALQIIQTWVSHVSPHELGSRRGSSIRSAVYGPMPLKIGCRGRTCTDDLKGAETVWACFATLSNWRAVRGATT